MRPLALTELPQPFGEAVLTIDELPGRPKHVERGLHLVRPGTRDDRCREWECLLEGAAQLCIGTRPVPAAECVKCLAVVTCCRRPAASSQSTVDRICVLNGVDTGHCRDQPTFVDVVL